MHSDSKLSKSLQCCSGQPRLDKSYTSFKPFWCQFRVLVLELLHLLLFFSLQQWELHILYLFVKLWWFPQVLIQYYNGCALWHGIPALSTYNRKDINYSKVVLSEFFYPVSPNRSDLPQLCWCLIAWFSFLPYSFNDNLLEEFLGSLRTGSLCTYHFRGSLSNSILFCITNSIALF